LDLFFVCVANKTHLGASPEALHYPMAEIACVCNAVASRVPDTALFELDHMRQELRIGEASVEVRL
jgi:hypothetical protein